MSEKAESFPVSPRNWTVSNDISGIININEANFNEKQSGTTPAYGTSAINPGPANYPGADQNIATTKQNVLMLRNDDKIDSFEVECESLESIHNHSAWAFQQEG